MKKRLFAIGFAFFLLVICSITIYAHSGNTDSRGGHYDQETGQYHFHHGWPAHPHQNGVCPYAEAYKNALNNTEETDNQRDVWIALGVVIGFPVVVIVVLRIAMACWDAKKRAAAIIPDFMVWYSPTGKCYHSSKACSVLKNTKNVYWATDKTNTSSIYDKKPCSKCCFIENGKVYPKNPTEQESKLPSMVSVVSSNLKEVGYQRGALYVLFHNGSLYRYDNVPQRLAEQLMMSRSAGKFFNKHIRDQYDYEYISTP